MSKLFALGFGHSIETYVGNVLVGGLYGIHLGGVFFGESMFSHASDASKVAMARLVDGVPRTRHPGHRLPGGELPFGQPRRARGVRAANSLRCCAATPRERRPVGRRPLIPASATHV
jgi:hypothetical protein